MLENDEDLNLYCDFTNLSFLFLCRKQTKREVRLVTLWIGLDHFIPTNIWSIMLAWTVVCFCFRETEIDWEQDYRNDVLEEVTKLGIVVHIAVDKVSPEGNVYLKCLTADVCGKISQSFNGRWFAGRTIRAVPIPPPNYNTMFPDSSNAVRPIKPSPR